jgi:hypothetical protein
MSIQRVGVHTATHHPSVNEAGNRTGYRILNGSTTVSKSAQSKIKNLADKLSAPFRAVMRQIVQSRAGDRASTGGLTNIKSPTSSASTPKEMVSQSGVAYQIVGGAGGMGKFKPPPPSFIWG